MNNTKQIYEHITALYMDFVDNHEESMNGNKAAGSRSRKALGEIKKLVTAYRKASVEASK
jgi:hypothetical protein